MGRCLVACCAAALCAVLLAGCSADTGTQADSAGSSEAVSASSASAASSGSGSSKAEKAEGPSKSSAAASSRSTRNGVPSALKKQVRSVLQNADVHASFCYVDLDTGKRYGVAADRRMVSASSIKLLILAAFLDQVHAGALSMDDTRTLTADDLVGGTGSLQNRAVGSAVTLREAARLMISESDNVGANMLIDAMGVAAINKEADRLGLTGTQLNRRMMQDNGMQNYMTASDAATILEDIYRGRLASKKLSAFALKCLEQQTDDEGFLAGLPQESAFAHKTGTLSSPEVKNDAGIVEGKRPYILVAFTQGPTEQGLQTMASLAHAVQATR